MSATERDGLLDAGLILNLGRLGGLLEKGVLPASQQESECWQRCSQHSHTGSFANRLSLWN